MVRIQFVFAPPIGPPKFAGLLEGMMPPMGIMYLAAYLRHHRSGLEIQATDGLVKPFGRTLAEIRRFAPDVLCVSSVTAAALGAYELINVAKREIPGLVAIIGGPHASALPEDALNRSKADVVVRGEGEETLLQLIKLLQDDRRLGPDVLAGVLGVAYRDSTGEVKLTAPRPYTTNLDELPFPALDLLPQRQYRGFYLHKQAPEAPMMFSRGCPADCTFCSNEHWKLSKPFLRVRSPRNVVDEMEQRYREGYREIHDMSDELNNDVGNAIGICEEIVRRDLHLTWKTCLRAHPLPEELVAAMARAGCWLVNLGVESGNAETLRGIRKLVTLDQIEGACIRLRKHGIKVHGLLMLFNVWEERGDLRYETAEMTRNTLQFVDRLVKRGLLNYFGWSITTPYPGSELHTIALKHDLIKPELLGNWDTWVKDEPFVMQLPGVTELDMASLKRQGSVLRAKCMLRNGHFGLRDVPTLVRKAVRVAASELSLRLRTKPEAPRVAER